ncbi:unnamed protein product [Brugia pahangi]|uniref:7TM_GPCR_Srx domain-containing protein n=1 Tax=Brugia pahangi TaxID=6280 RepID=A0A0N4TZL9_BRUPA|nr:unnamed protein product [Brugia pahangi]
MIANQMNKQQVAMIFLFNSEFATILMYLTKQRLFNLKEKQNCFKFTLYSIRINKRSATMTNAQFSFFTSPLLLCVLSTLILLATPQRLIPESEIY